MDKVPLTVVIPLYPAQKAAKGNDIKLNIFIRQKRNLDATIFYYFVTGIRAQNSKIQLVHRQSGFQLCRKNKIKERGVITLANHNQLELEANTVHIIITSAGKCLRASHDLIFAFGSHWLRIWREFTELTSHGAQ